MKASNLNAIEVSEVARAFARLDTALSDLDTTLEILVGKIVPVLTPEMPEAGCAEDPINPATMSELAAAVHVKASAIEAINASMAGVARRVEL